jgi:hypothetical protein
MSDESIANLFMPGPQELESVPPRHRQQGPSPACLGPGGNMSYTMSGLRELSAEAHL